MKVEYDPEAKALYIKILENVERGKTEELTEDVLIDKTKSQQICGIEVLNIDSFEVLKREGVKK